MLPSYEKQHSGLPTAVISSSIAEEGDEDDEGQ